MLHDVRHSLPGIDKYLEIDNEIVRWIPTEKIDLDVWRFQEAVAAGDLELAARLYAGDLLPACYDDWVLHERESLRGEVRQCLAQLTQEAAGRGDHRATIRFAQRMIELEPTDEIAVRSQMEGYLALGDRAGALRAFHRCAETLERELAVAPGEGLKGIYQQLRAETAGRGLDDQPQPASESPFVGRDLELNRLWEAWKTARESGAHLVVG